MNTQTVTSQNVKSEFRGLLAAEKNLAIVGQSPSDLYYKERELFVSKLAAFIRTDLTKLNTIQLLNVCSMVGAYRPVAPHSFLIYCANLIGD